MENFMRFSRSLLVALAVSLTPVAAISQVSNCQALLRDGTFDQFDSLTDEQMKWRMSQWYCESGSSSSSTTAGGSVDDLTSGLGYSGNYSSQDAWKRDFCSAMYSGLDVSRFNRTKVRQASATLVNGFNACVAAQAPGAVLSYAPGTSAMEFVLKVWFNPVAVGVNESGVTWQNAVESGCPAGQLPTKLSVGQPVTVVCKRNTRAGATIVANFDKVVAYNNTVQVPNIPAPPNCSATPIVSGNPLTVDAGPCNRTVNVTAYAHYAKGCDTSTVTGRLSRTIMGADTSELCVKADTDFSNAYLNCTGSFTLKPLQQARIHWNTADNHCANPVTVTMGTSMQ
ncbi:hypothetical protein ABIC83_002412 [Roseateles asaccharophilus]|uniref:hypothetical protein n=1 Tax=Roseateles asaccharophilus TaxID=582607 RepID=UPI0038329524